MQESTRRSHLVPTIGEFPKTPHYLYQAAQYLQMIFAEFDAAFAITPECQPAFEMLCEDLQSFGSVETVPPHPPADG